MIIGLFFIFTIVMFLLILILYLHCDHKNFMFNLKILNYVRRKNLYFSRWSWKH